VSWVWAKKRSSRSRSRRAPSSFGRLRWFRSTRRRATQATTAGRNRPGVKLRRAVRRRFQRVVGDTARLPTHACRIADWHHGSAGRVGTLLNVSLASARTRRPGSLAPARASILAAISTPKTCPRRSVTAAVSIPVPAPMSSTMPSAGRRAARRSANRAARSPPPRVTS